MITRVLPMDSGAAIDSAARLIRAGRLVAFATETVYGLGADVFNENAVSDIFAAKQRPPDNPLIAHICRYDDVNLLASHVPDAARALMEAFWPGPLTLIMPRANTVPRLVSAGLGTVAIRMPGHDAALSFIRKCGVPIAAPSANRSGLPSPTRAGHVQKDMAGRIPLILDGGPCAIGIESTVLNLSRGTPELLRPGAVTRERLEAVIGPVALSPGVLGELDRYEPAPSPGMRHRHYAPEHSRVVVLRGDADKAIEHILAHKDAGYGVAAALYDPQADALRRRDRSVRCLSMGHSATDYAAALFDALRGLDADGYDIIFCQAPADGGIGLALLNRLLRASSFTVVDL